MSGPGASTAPLENPAFALGEPRQCARRQSDTLDTATLASTAPWLQVWPQVGPVAEVRPRAVSTTPLSTTSPRPPVLSCPTPYIRPPPLSISSPASIHPIPSSVLAFRFCPHLPPPLSSPSPASFLTFPTLLDHFRSLIRSPPRLSHTLPLPPPTFTPRPRKLTQRASWGTRPLACSAAAGLPPWYPFP